MRWNSLLGVADIPAVPAGPGHSSAFLIAGPRLAYLFLSYHASRLKSSDMEIASCTLF